MKILKLYCVPESKNRRAWKRLPRKIKKKNGYAKIIGFISHAGTIFYCY